MNEDNTIDQPETGGEPNPVEQPAGGNAEAARWRHKTRAAEAVIEALNTKLLAAQRQLVEQHVQDRIAGSALTDYWSRIPDMSVLMNDETGDLDLGKIDEHTTGLLEANPHLAVRGTGAPVTTAASNVTSDGKISDTKHEASWADVLREGAKG
jgi:hypothetical protein